MDYYPVTLDGGVGVGGGAIVDAVVAVAGVVRYAVIAVLLCRRLCSAIDGIAVDYVCDVLGSCDYRFAYNCRHAVLGAADSCDRLSYSSRTSAVSNA